MASKEDAAVTEPTKDKEKEKDKDKKKKKKKVHVGDRAWMPKSPEYGKGTIRFIGPTKFKYGITWVGFELDKPVGKNSGWVKGLHYFDCKENHGVFSPIQQVELLEGDDALPDPEGDKEEEGEFETSEEEEDESDQDEEDKEQEDKKENSEEMSVSESQTDGTTAENEGQDTIPVVLKKKKKKKAPKPKATDSQKPVTMKPVDGTRKKRKTPKFAPTIDHPHLVFVPYDIDAHVYYRKFPEKLAGRVPEDKFFEILDMIEHSVEHQKLSNYHDKMETGPLVKYACFYGFLSMFTFCVGIILYWRFMDKMYKEGFASRRRLAEMLIVHTEPYKETTQWRFNPLVDDLTIVISIVK